jgi:ribonuclease T2
MAATMRFRHHRGMTRNQRALVSIVVIAAAAGIGLMTRTPPHVSTAGPPPRVATTVPDAQTPASTRASTPARGFDYYLVALSWSPTWCESNPHDREQCGARGYGFVLHGLWPQYERGGGPQDCATRERPDAATVARTLAFMPSRRLIEHEWRAHGACSGLGADDYFALSDRAYAAVRIPPVFQPRATPGSMDVDAVRDAFIAANPGLEADMFAVVCRARDLAEVRVCVDTDLAPRRCGRDVRTRCPRNVDLRIPSLR